MAKAVYKLFSLVTLVACFYVCNCQCDPAYLQVGGKLTHECTVIYEKLESALVNNKDNLLVLRDTFFSSFHRSPSFLTVTYDFLVTDSDDGITSVLLYSGWSSSPLYSVTDPGVLLALHSGLLLVAFEDADLAVFPKYITLTLDLREDTDENITQLANGTINGNLDYAIQTLTTRLKAYAKEQGNLNSWDGSNRGYNWTSPTFESGDTDPLVALLIPSTSIFLVILIASWRFAPILQTKVEQGNDLINSLFWSSAVVVFCVNGFEVFWDVVLQAVICTVEHSSQVCAGRLVLLSTVLFLSIVISLSFIRQFHMVYSFPLPPLVLCVSRFLCCTCFCSKRWQKKFLYWFAYFNFFLFISFVGKSVIPTVLLMFIHPIEVLAILTYISAIIFFIVVYVSVPIASTNIMANFKCCIQWKKYAYQFGYIAISILILASLIQMTEFYLKVLAITGVNSTMFSNIIFPALPPIVIAVVGLVVQRVFLSKHTSTDQDTEDDRQSTSSEKTEIEMLSLAEREVVEHDDSEDAPATGSDEITVEVKDDSNENP